MKQYTYNEIFTKIVNIIKRFVKTKQKKELQLLLNLNIKYRLYSSFWKTIISQSNEYLLNKIIMNIYSTPDVIKALNYYFENMSKSNNEVKYYNILEFVAINYRHIAPTLRTVPRLYRILK